MSKQIQLSSGVIAIAKNSTLTYDARVAFALRNFYNVDRNITYYICIVRHRVKWDLCGQAISGDLKIEIQTFSFIDIFLIDRISTWVPKRSTNKVWQLTVQSKVWITI